MIFSILKSHSECDGAWITREDLQRLVLYLLEYYESHQESYLTGSSSSYLKELMVTPYRLIFVPINIIDIVYFDFTRQLLSPHVIVVFGSRLSPFGLHLS